MTIEEGFGDAAATLFGCLQRNSKSVYSEARKSNHLIRIKVFQTYTFPGHEATIPQSNSDRIVPSSLQKLHIFSAIYYLSVIPEILRI